MPRLLTCYRNHWYEYLVKDPEITWFKEKDETAKFNWCGFNETEDRYEFYHDDELTAWARCDTYIACSRSPKVSGKRYTIATIRFTASGKTYDYLCDIDDIKPGDTVVVAGYDGEIEVPVVSVQSIYESELALPFEKYKSILRKA